MSKGEHGAGDVAVDQPKTRLASFAASSRIRAARGEIAAEHLQPGDLVVAVRRGGFAAVHAVRCRRVRPRDLPRPWTAAPVRVCAHAFGWDRPCRDLLLSPDHAVYVDGVLFRAADLLNGVTIVRQDVAEVAYAQIELDRHDVLIADGLPVESFRDNGGDDDSPERRQWDADACAQLVWQGPKLAATRLALAAQAARLGYRPDSGFADGPAVRALLRLQTALDEPNRSNTSLPPFQISWSDTISTINSPIQAIQR
jgi:hypothetical protein